MKNILVIPTLAILVSFVVFGSESRRQAGDEPPEHVSFQAQDGWLIYANLYGKGDRGVVLAHGGRKNKESWEEQAQALVKGGFRVLAFDFRKPRLPKIRDQHERAPGPKELVILECSAHAQFIFETDQGDRLMREILRFLSQP